MKLKSHLLTWVGIALIIVGITVIILFERHKFSLEYNLLPNYDCIRATQPVGGTLAILDLTCERS